MLLLPGEKILQQWDEHAVVLTNQRISYQKKKWGKTRRYELPLDKITYYQTHRHSQKWMLLAGAAFFVLSFISTAFRQNAWILCISLPVSFVCSLYYFKSHCHFIVIATNEKTVKIRVDSGNHEEVSEIVSLVEEVRTIAWRNMTKKKYCLS